MRKLTLFCLALFILSTSPALAQFEDLLGGASSVYADPEITLKPSSPEPGERVTASVNSYIPSVNGSAISWKLDGKEIPGSANKNSVSFVAGKDGMEQTITTTFNTPKGQTIVVKDEFTPRYLDIIIEPQTHVPSFYLGRAMPSTGSLVNATLLISGLNSYSDYLFTWRVGRTVVGGSSQRGKNFTSFETTLDRYMLLSVEVTGTDGSLVAKKTVSVPSVNPFLKFYEYSPLLGLSNQPINKSLSLIGNVTTVRAEPYYLDSRVYNNPAIADWTLNKASYTDTNSNPYEVTLKRGGTSGRSTLNFHVRDTAQLLQGARGSIGINL